VIGFFPGALVSAGRIVIVAGICVLAGSHVVLAQQASPENAADAEEALVERIKREILRDLMRDGALDAQINAGIERFIAKQRAAQAAASARAQQRSVALAKNIRPVSPQRDHIYGNPNAEVSLIEYSDFECPFCKRFHVTAKEVIDSYDGRVNWVYRHFPLAFHNPGAQKQAEASECAGALGGNDAFWGFADKIYERTRSNGHGFPLSGLLPLAEEIGLDTGDFRACLESGKFTGRVLEDYTDGTNIGITGTPGNVLRNNQTGKVVVRAGAVPAANLKNALDGLLR
jgi:protein-disulfide isomerase